MGSVYIGLMSGTSLDGVDGVLVDLGNQGVCVLAYAHRPFEATLHDALMALNTPGADELDRAALAANALVGVYADVVADLRRVAPGVAVTAIGAHGQTVRHRPGHGDGIGYTLQLNAPALLAERTGLSVVADFRSRDLAAGGQGAPLVPAFHRARFGCPGTDVAVVNIGGISNLTLLHADGRVDGFDCGPGNALMDLWCRRHLDAAFDDRGIWAASGRPLSRLLNAALADRYFGLPPPKSTGRDDFHAGWLDALIAKTAAGADPADIQATLLEITARCIADDLRRWMPAAGNLIVCGGGALNDALMARLRTRCAPASVLSSASRGLPPLQVEACAFAWLAQAHIERASGNLPSATGAAGPRILGAHHPA